MNNIYEINTLNKNIFENGKEKSILNIDNLTIKDKEITFIMGGTGSGKTTLLHILGFIDNIFDVKSFSFIEKKINMKKFLSMKKDISLIFQDAYLVDTLRVKDNITLPSFIKNENIKLEKLEEIIEELEIKDLLTKFPMNLSGGQRQRVAIATALYNNSKVILADEPTSALDSNMSKKVMELFKSFNKEHNIPIIIITHDEQNLSFFEEYNLINIKNGRIV